MPADASTFPPGTVSSDSPIDATPGNFSSRRKLTSPQRHMDRMSRSGLDGVVVVIPALNEEKSLPLVLADLPAVRRVVVVDNGSSDATARIAREQGADVVNESRQGYGSACLRGLARIRELTEQGEAEPQIVVFLDADYSDHPDLLPRLVQPIVNDRTDLVLGSRLLGQRERGAMPPQSVYGNRFACLLMYWFFGVEYSDLGPFRAIRYQCLFDLGMEDKNFGWTIEMQIKAVVHGLRIREVPVPYRCRVGVSKISGTLRGTVLAGSKILTTIARYGMARFCSRDGQSQPAMPTRHSRIGNESDHSGVDPSAATR